jgi:hypothetical protein
MGFVQCRNPKWPHLGLKPRFGNYGFQHWKRDSFLFMYENLTKPIHLKINILYNKRWNSNVLKLK